MRRQVCRPLLAAGLLACESASSPEPVLPREVTPNMVTGAALAALKPDGRFMLAYPPTASGELSISEAEDQAPEFAKYVTNQLVLRGVVEGERGGYWTDPHLLSVCGDTYYVHSQLQLVMPDSIPATAAESFLRRFGSQWIVPMCGPKGEPQMTVQAAIRGNGIRFANGDPVEPPSQLTTAWYARGVPLNWPDPLTISAERAARFAFETLGVRVAEVPELHFRGDVLGDGRYAWYQVGSARFCHRWRIVLETEVRLRGMPSFTETTTRVVYVASGTCSQRDVAPYLHVPAGSQPDRAILDFVDYSSSPPKTWTLSVPVTEPTRFELATRAP